MSAGNQEIDQQFDDDYMLQLALQMSLQGGEAPSPASEPQTPVTETPAEASMDQGTAEPMDIVEPAPKTPSAEAAPTSSPATSPSAEPNAEPSPAANASAASGSADAAAMDVAPVAPSKKVKKSKKNKYKDLMAGLTAPTRSEDEAAKVHEDKLKKTMGGGQFSKLDKI